jgi:hypothetical protein
LRLTCNPDRATIEKSSQYSSNYQPRALHGPHRVSRAPAKEK